MTKSLVSAMVLAALAGAANAQSIDVRIIERNSQTVANSADAVLDLAIQARVNGGGSLGGFGFNAVTGDFSRGAAGFWIEDGELAFPVSEVTISLNVDELYKRIDAVGSDLDLRTATAAPTLRVGRMTVAGSG